MEQTASIASQVQSSLVTSLTDVASNMGSTIVSVLPVALGVVGAVMVVTFGIKIFKKVTGK
jgi:phage-related protein